MMNIGLHYGGVAPQLRTILQPKLHRCPNDQVINGFESLRRKANEAALKGVVLGHRSAVEVGELAQRQSIGDTFAQLAIVPVLQPHQNQRAEDLARRQSAAPTPGLLKSSHQIESDILDDLLVLVEKGGDGCKLWLEAYALLAVLHQFPVGKTELSRRRSRHRSALLDLRRFRPLPLQRFEVSRRGLLQQLLQGAPFVQSAPHLRHQFFRNVNGNTAALHSAIQNITWMLLT